MKKRCRHKWDTLSKRVRDRKVVHEIARCTKCDTYRVMHEPHELILRDGKGRPCAVLDTSLLR